MPSPSELLSSLVSAYTDWHELLFNPQFKRDGQSLTWRDCTRPRLPRVVTVADVLRLIRERQYSLLFQRDCSVLQLYYRHDGQNVVEASLAFYSALPCGRVPSQDLVDMLSVDTGFDSEQREALINALEEWGELSIREELGQPVFWLRADLDPVASSSGVLHHLTHLHVAGAPDSRIPFDGFPNPRQFIDFVIATCYPTDYGIRRLDRDGSFVETAERVGAYSPEVSTCGHELGQYCVHLRVPQARPTPPTPPSPARRRTRPPR